MLGEKRNQNPGIAGERVEGEGVLEFTEIEGGGWGDVPGGVVDGVEDVGKVKVNFDRGAELDAHRSGEVAVMTAVGAKAVRGKVPVVRAGVVALVAETDGGFEFAENEGLFAGVMLGKERISGDLDFGVGEMGLIENRPQGTGGGCGR